MWLLPVEDPPEGTGLGAGTGEGVCPEAGVLPVRLRPVLLCAPGARRRSPNHQGLSFDHLTSSYVLIERF
ncbi:MAG TPA: hypothetical protein VFH56_06450, partial [Acidimicrobiales bacterium]|nr:hypothetical protein [Acidimicrobiales bacterium]